MYFALGGGSSQSTTTPCTFTYHNCTYNLCGVFYFVIERPFQVAIPLSAMFLSSLAVPLVSIFCFYLFPFSSLSLHRKILENHIHRK